MMSSEAPAYRQTKYNTIVNVTNLGVNMTNDRLRKMFENYGTILSYGVLNDDEPSRRFAFVTFEDSDAADEAVIELNGQLIDDNRRLRVRRTRKSENNRDKPRSWSRNARKDETVAEVSSYDAAAEASSNRAAAEGSSNHAAPRVYQWGAAATTSTSDVTTSGGYGNSPQIGHSVFVQNLDRNVDRIGLRKPFEKYGRILEAKVIMHTENNEVKSRGYGFVTFLHEADAQKAQREMMGRLIGTQTVRVEMAHRSRPVHPDIASLPPTLARLRLGRMGQPRTGLRTPLRTISRPREPSPLSDFEWRSSAWSSDSE